MPEVKWIKLVTDMFDNRKIRQIETMPDADSILVIWLKLLCLAGKVNECGAIMFTPDIPYTDEMLSREFDRPINTVRLALTTFERFGMIELSDTVYHVSNWEKYQNTDGMERIREQTRKRMADYRARQRAGLLPDGKSCVYCGKDASAVDHIIPQSKGGTNDANNLVPCCKNCNSSKKDKDLADFLNDSLVYTYQGVDHELVRSNSQLMQYVEWDEENKRYGDVTSRYGDVTHLDIDIDKEEDKDISNDISVKVADAPLTPAPPSVDYAEVSRLFHECCPSIKPTNHLPTLTEKRKQHIRVMVREIGPENLRRLFESAEASDFLTGRNGAWTGCAFDWLINRNNAIKVLEGNYDNKTQDKPGFRPPEPKEWN